jgi:hypothetical protein
VLPEKLLFLLRPKRRWREERVVILWFGLRRKALFGVLRLFLLTVELNAINVLSLGRFTNHLFRAMVRE